MPIADEIKKEIAKYSRSKKPDDMVRYLKEQLVAGNVSVKDLFYYADRFIFTNDPSKPHVINPSIINKLGVVVAGLKDGKQSKLDTKFFKLAADRDSDWGCRNYASEIIDEDASKALEYAKKSIELSKIDEHKFILCKVLRKNKKYAQANKALVDYLKFKEQSLKESNHAKKKEKLSAEINEAYELISQIMKEFFSDFKDGFDLTDDRCKSNLDELEALHQFKRLTPAVSEKIVYLKAKFQEKLKLFPEAMQAYCSLDDKKFKYYDDVIQARSRLLKAQVTKDCGLPAAPAVFLPPHKDPLVLTLPDGSSFFSENDYWSEEANWFDSINKDKIKAKLQKIRDLIDSKECEIQKLRQTEGDESSKKLRILELNNDLENLEEIEEKLNKVMSVYRQVFRRHAAESHFFVPRRSKKANEISKLANSIIGQRFRTGEAQPNPINLSGKSTRLVISAEKAFQDAVITLTGANFPVLGIPTGPATDEPWEFNGYTGVNLFGPLEKYKVGSTIILSKHRGDPKRSRLGTSKVERIGKYTKDITVFLNKLAKNVAENEKKLASWMIRYGKKHQPITLQELQTMYEHATEEDVNKFNRICFLILEKEQSQWHSANKEIYQLGMSVSQARCLIMIEAGFLRFGEAFNNDFLFGVYSQTDMINNYLKVDEACRRIDKLYVFYLQNKKSQDHVKFLKKHIDNDDERICILTRKQAHEDLKAVYGGDSDTDDEGYDSDLSM